MNDAAGVLFKKLIMNTRVVLSTRKLNKLKDYIICSPDMMTNAFTDRKIQTVLILPGTSENKIRHCLDIQGTLQSLNIRWYKVDDDTTWFMKMVPHAVLRRYTCRYILESLSNVNKYRLYFDLNGILYKLNSNVNIMT